MLPAPARMRRRAEFTTTVRTGRRAATRALTVHAAPVPAARRPCARIGFVVPRAVGTAVDRNRVRRRLRHLLAARLPTLPVDRDLVVRVGPRAAAMSSAELDRELDRALSRLSPNQARAEGDISRGDA